MYISTHSKAYNFLTVYSTSDSDVTGLEDVGLRQPRKRKVRENEQAREQRDLNQKRLRDQAQRRHMLHQKLLDQATNSTIDTSRIIINDAKSDEQGFVYIDEEIGKRIKPHQIDGVRFMWRQVVNDGSGNEDQKLQGCLLAHTMGLGKTMQVITLLVAIAEAAKSSDPTVESQIPPNLRESRTLVLCPPTLIDNWMDELITWAPAESLGDLRKVASKESFEDRLDNITQWYLEGGVLVIGYEMFRDLLLNKSTLHRAPRLSPEEHNRVEVELLEGPTLVIADEAHKMKNAAASLTSVASRFKSSNRIALTGSPLANNVMEYHTMIEWISPNYLGPIAEFKAKYIEPIEQGLYEDSLIPERRRSLKMIGVLKQDLAPKVHRADLSVLRDELKPKLEFFITVELTPIQKAAYIIYVKKMLSTPANSETELTKKGELQQTTIWHWLAVLNLLCNHPMCFKEKLAERFEQAHKENAKQQRLESADSNDAIEAINHNPVWKVGVSDSLIRDELAHFDSYGGNLAEPIHSPKMVLFLEILNASIEAGDKVLVFSSSIPTLNYLEYLCKRFGKKYGRLDGATAMSKRQIHTKAFNTDARDVYLISTMAGGLGLNLPGANRVIIFDFKYNPVAEEQAVGRAYRIGQKKPVFVYRFVMGGTFEDTIYNTAVFKVQLASQVVDKKNIKANAKKKVAGDFLFEPKHVEQNDLSEFIGKDPLVLDKILARQNGDPTIRKITMTDVLQMRADESLTAEELKEVQQMIEDKHLKRTNPAGFAALEAKRSQEKMALEKRLARPTTMSNVQGAQQAHYHSRLQPLLISQPVPPRARELPLYEYTRGHDFPHPSTDVNSMDNFQSPAPPATKFSAKAKAKSDNPPIAGASTRESLVTTTGPAERIYKSPFPAVDHGMAPHSHNKSAVSSAAIPLDRQRVKAQPTIEERLKADRLASAYSNSFEAQPQIETPPQPEVQDHQAQSKLILSTENIQAPKDNMGLDGSSGYSDVREAVLQLQPALEKGLKEAEENGDSSVTLILQRPSFYSKKAYQLSEQLLQKFTTKRSFHAATKLLMEKMNQDETICVGLANQSFTAVSLINQIEVPSNLENVVHISSLTQNTQSSDHEVCASTESTATPYQAAVESVSPTLLGRIRNATGGLFPRLT
jgi:SNF2 family DNA or RNA helicase